MMKVYSVSLTSDSFSSSTDGILNFPFSVTCDGSQVLEPGVSSNGVHDDDVWGSRKEALGLPSDVWFTFDDGLPSVFSPDDTKECSDLICSWAVH